MNGPTNITHEQALIGALLYHQQYQAHLAEVHPEYFSDAACRDASAAMHEISNAGDLINRITLYPKIGLTEEDTDDPFMMAMDRIRGSSTGDMPAFFSLVDSVRNDYALRRIHRLHENGTKACYQQGADAATLVKRAIEELNEIDAIMQLGQKTGVRFDEGMERHAERQGGSEATACVPTGLRGVDDQLGGGLPLGGLCALGGHTSMGKTALITQVALNAARSGHGVALASMEMTEEQTFARLGSSMLAGTNVASPYREQLAAKGLLHDDPDALVEATRHWLRESGNPFYADFRPMCTVSDIASLIATARREFRELGKLLSLVIVDYLQEMPGTEDTTGTARVVADLKALAKRENVAILVLSQINRKNVDANGFVNRPGPGAMLNSSAIEFHADVVMFVHRDAYNAEQPGNGLNEVDRFELLRRRDELELILTKVRNGAIGMAELTCDLANNHIIDRVGATPINRAA